MQTFLLTGYFGRGNLGDNLMHDALRDELRVTFSGAKVDSVPLPRMTMHGIGDAIRLLVAARRSNVCLLAGGSHFHDRLGARSFRLLLAFWALFAVIRILGCQVGFVGIGIGPLTKRQSLYLTKHILGLAKCVVTRDQASFALAVSLRPRDAIVQGADLAFLLKVPRATTGGGSLSVGIDIRPYFRVFERNTPHSDDDLVRMIGKAVSNDSVKSKLTDFLILCACTQAREGHAELSTRLGRELSSVGLKASLRDAVHPSLALEALGGSNFAIVMRYHVMVLAYLLGVPSVLIVYDAKSVALAEQLKLPKEAVLNVFDAVQTGALAAKVRDGLGEPRKLLSSVPVDTMKGRAMSGLHSALSILVDNHGT